MIRFLRDFIVDLRDTLREAHRQKADPMLVDVARNFAKVPHDHPDLDRIGHGEMLTAAQVVEREAEQKARQQKVTPMRGERFRA